MRTVLFGLILLAVGKVWYQDHTYRMAMSDAVIEAYRTRAVDACRKSTPKRLPNASTSASSAWSANSKAEAVIGNPGISVAIWDTENPLWNQRFRDPQLLLISNDSAVRCSYDVRRDMATLSASTF